MREEEITIGSKWRHFKGDVMEVILLAKHSETLETMVLYTHRGEVWARPITSFLSSENISYRVDNKTGQKYRFEKIENDIKGE